MMKVPVTSVSLLLLSPCLLTLNHNHQTAIDFLPKTSWSLVGHTALLPCEIEPENPLEQLYTVLWYKDDDGEPIYTYDARTSDILAPSHWSEEEPRGFCTRLKAHEELFSLTEFIPVLLGQSSQ